MAISNLISNITSVPTENLKSCYPVRKSDMNHIEIIGYHRHINGALPRCSYVPNVVKTNLPEESNPH